MWRESKGRHGTDPWPTESLILPIDDTNCLLSLLSLLSQLSRWHMKFHTALLQFGVSADMFVLVCSLDDKWVTSLMGGAKAMAFSLWRGPWQKAYIRETLNFLRCADSSTEEENNFGRKIGTRIKEKSGVRCQMLRVTCHLSPVTCQQSQPGTLPLRTPPVWTAGCQYFAWSWI